MALGTLIIKQRTGHSDDEVLQDIIENPYMQYLIGLHEFTTKAPFSQSSVTNFRKYITPDMLKEINDELFRKSKGKENADDGGNENDPNGDGGSIPKTSRAQAKQSNQGVLMLDATCVPANITYPTDVGLLNEAREKLEEIIDTLHPLTGRKLKPRTYRENARKKYLSFVRKRSHRKDEIRRAIGQQLRYVKRDLRHVDIQLLRVSADVLSKSQRKWLETIRELYKQQFEMYTNRTHSVDDRIVSINQPHVRPMVRGKKNAGTEFGAKVSISLTGDGYAFIDKLDWDAYNESSLLIPALETYKETNGCYPKVVLADKIYRSRKNIDYCKKRGVRLSGPRLGRPPKVTDKRIIKQDKEDSSKRNAVEGKFGEGKVKYGLDRIMARLKDSSETVIALAFFCMNISRRLRVLLHRFLNLLNCLFSPCFFRGIFIIVGF
jgi:hypothetical protein